MASFLRRYDRGTDEATIQFGVVALGNLLYALKRITARPAERTDVPTGMERGFRGGLRHGTIEVQAPIPRERTLREATERVSAGCSDSILASS